MSRSMFSIGYAAAKRVKRGDSGTVGAKVCNKCATTQRDFFMAAILSDRKVITSAFGIRPESRIEPAEYSVNVRRLLVTDARRIRVVAGRGEQTAIDPGAHSRIAYLLPSLSYRPTWLRTVITAAIVELRIGQSAVGTEATCAHFPGGRPSAYRRTRLVPRPGRLHHSCKGLSNHGWL